MALQLAILILLRHIEQKKEYIFDEHQKERKEIKKNGIHSVRSETISKHSVIYAGDNKKSLRLKLSYCNI